MKSEVVEISGGGGTFVMTSQKNLNFLGPYYSLIVWMIRSHNFVVVYRFSSLMEPSPTSNGSWLQICLGSNMSHFILSVFLCTHPEPGLCPFHMFHTLISNCLPVLCWITAVVVKMNTLSLYSGLFLNLFH